jgi:tRNA (cmo5U34)-methyltransferase
MAMADLNPSQIFNQNHANRYDEKNAKVAAIVDNMHFLIPMVLDDLPEDSTVLCVGVGTGTEILSLAQLHPKWHFVASDPSEHMITVCTDKLSEAGLSDRCKIIHGYVDDVPSGILFDAVLNINVSQFVKHDKRLQFYTSMVQRLKSKGILIDVEISMDLDAPEFPYMLKNWEKIQRAHGATPESIEKLPDVLRSTLTVLAPSHVQQLLKESGLGSVIQFFQSFGIVGWYGIRG